MSDASDAINTTIRAARGDPVDFSDPGAINAAIRRAAGRDPGPAAAPERPAGARFTRDEYRVRHGEPAPGHSTLADWNQWAWRRASGLLDRHGRLPGEGGYDPASSGRSDTSGGYDPVQAIVARKRRWRDRDALVREADDE
jgi:hypothetical protein